MRNKNQHEVSLTSLTWNGNEKSTWKLHPKKLKNKHQLWQQQLLFQVVIKGVVWILKKPQL